MLENLNRLCLGELSSVLHRQYQIYMNRGMKPYHIGFSECGYLLKIADGEAVTQSYIAERLFCDNAVVTRNLQTLEQKGLVRRHPSPGDKRAVLVSLTPDGAKAKQAGLRMREEWRKQMMSDISADEEKKILRRLRAMTEKAFDLTQYSETQESKLRL